MSDDDKTEPPWKAALRSDIECAIGLNQDCGGAEGVCALRDEVMAAVLPHMETAHKTGRMAGASKAGYRLVNKNLELSRKLRLVREVADALEDRQKEEPDNARASGLYEAESQLRQTFGEDEGASEAEAEIRKKALLEAAEAVTSGDVPYGPSALKEVARRGDPMALIAYAQLAIGQHLDHMAEGDS